MMYQPLKLVGHKNVPLLRIRDGESVPSPMLAFVKVTSLNLIVS